MASQAKITSGKNWSWDSRLGVITIFDATGSYTSDGHWAICNLSLQPEPSEELHALLTENARGNVVAVGPLTATKLFLAKIIEVNDLENAIEGDRRIVCRDVKVGAQMLRLDIESENKTLQRRWYNRAALGKAKALYTKV